MKKKICEKQTNPEYIMLKKIHYSCFYREYSVKKRMLDIIYITITIKQHFETKNDTFEEELYIN